jgi:phosphate transport system substrate-binding protein
MKHALVIVILLSGLLFGCGGGEVSIPSATPTLPQTVSIEALTVETYPVVDGSTSALPLQQMAACHIFQIECDWTEAFLFDLTRNILPAMEVVDQIDAVEYLFNLSHSGTHGAYMNLIEGNAEVILVARQPSEDELEAARKNGVVLDFRPVALDAFVFLVNEANPLESIEIGSIRDIYTERVTTWDEMGVDVRFEGDSTIHTYRRNPNSGSQELMESLVMEGEEMVDSPDLLLYEMVGPFNAIGHDPLGIGYSVYYYATNMLPTETVRLVAVAEVLPTTESIANRSYPFVTEVYVVVRADAPPDGTAVQLRNWLLTAEGQAVVSQSGYVSIDDN